MYPSAGSKRPNQAMLNDDQKMTMLRNGTRVASNEVNRITIKLAKIPIDLKKEAYRIMDNSEYPLDPEVRNELITRGLLDTNGEAVDQATKLILLASFEKIGDQLVQRNPFDLSRASLGKSLDEKSADLVGADRAALISEEDERMVTLHNGSIVPLSAVELIHTLFLKTMLPHVREEAYRMMKDPEYDVNSIANESLIIWWLKGEGDSLDRNTRNIVISSFEEKGGELIFRNPIDTSRAS